MAKMPKLPTIRTRRSNRLSSTFDAESRTVDAVLATSEWIDGPYGPERLVMTDQAVDLAAASPMPLHDDHGPHLAGTQGQRIGVVENPRVSNGKLKGRLRFSKNPGGEQAMTDVEDGIITHVSVGYRVIDAKPTKRGLLITRWAPHEVSTPSVVADRSAVIQRTANMDVTQDELTRDDENTPIEETEAYQAGQRAAAERITQINHLFDQFPNATDLRVRAMAETWTVDQARGELLSWLGKQNAATRGYAVQAGEDQVQKFVRGCSEALQVRCMLISGEKAEAVRRENEYFGYSLKEMAREYLRVANDSTRGTAMDIVGRAFTRAGLISHSTSDFANILVDASNKALQLGYEEAPETYEVWTRAGTLPDFKVGHRPKLSTFSDLDEVVENAEITYGTYSDFKETIQLLSYGKLFSISRKAIINDDLNAFNDVPRGMGRAARRKVGDLVYGILSTNGNMSDGNALFSSAHSNYVAAGSGAVPSVATLNTAYTSMALQTDPGGATLNITPTYILIPHALRGTVDALLQSALNPAEGGTTAFQEFNVWRARLTPVYEARIDSDDAAKWYLTSSVNQIDTIEVAYLNGQQSPRMEQEDGFTVDGVIMKVAHDVGVSPLDWRGMYHNDGN